MKGQMQRTYVLTCENLHTLLGVGNYAWILIGWKNWTLFQHFDTVLEHN